MSNIIRVQKLSFGDRAFTIFKDLVTKDEEQDVLYRIGERFLFEDERVALRSVLEEIKSTELLEVAFDAGLNPYS